MEKCSFHPKFPDINCNTDFNNFNEFNRQEQTTLLSEIGLLFNDTYYRFSICTSHLSLLQDIQRKRQRKKTCEIPDFFNDHSLKAGTRNKRTAISADRYLSLAQSVQIQQRTGHVLPIGTPICRNCRRKLLSTCSAECQENQNVDFMYERDSNDNNVMNNENDSLKLNNTGVTADRWCIREKRSSNTDTFSKDNQVYLTDEEESQISMTSTQGSSYHPEEDSQETATDSQISIQAPSPLKLLNTYLQTVDVSPVHKIRGHLSEAGNRTRRRYISKAKRCIMAMLNTICPEEGEDLLKHITSNSEQVEDDLVEEAIICAYKKAESWTLQRQLLSILASKKSFNQIKSVIPNLSNWRYRLAREHVLKHGAGNPVSNDKMFRQSIDPSRIESFLDFITSSDVIKDLPFGEKTMKLSSGETIQTPNVIRCIAPAAIVRQYDQYCEENDIVKIGHSTMYRILQVCPASIQKSVEGIDYFVVEGSRAFEDLIWIVKQIYSTREEQEAAIKVVNDCKQYIKHDFKIHLEEKSEIKDHCLHFALNDKDKKLRDDCTDHQHTNGCPNCQQLTDILDQVEAKVEEMKDELADDLFDEVKFKTSKAISDIIDWRKHLVRSKNQMRAKTREITLLSETRAIIIGDWAMKFLPRKFREGQTDWYAKRGINWHIGVAITRSGDSLQALTFVHIFTGQTAQDAHTSALVLCDIAMDVQALRPNIKQISFYSDNAGCYKSTLTLAMLHAKLGQLVTSYNFSEAQDGKGPCDRKASHIKAEVKRYVNEGHNVLEAEDMKKAIDSRGNYRCKVVSFEPHSKPNIKPIPGITSYSNFKFTDEGITVWKAFEIGQGKCLPWNQIYKEREAMTSSLKVLQDSNSVTFADMRSSVKKDPEVNQQGEHEQNTEHEESVEASPPSTDECTENEIFCCPVEGCIKTFIRHSNLEEHVLVGNCSFKVKRESTLDTTKKIYKDKVTNKVDKMYSLSSEIVEAKDNVAEGWALKSRKPHTMLSDNQREYLVEKFDVGIKTGKKEDPASVANDMRRARKNGSKRFKMNEYLTTQQIASFFSREAKKRTEQTIAAKLETNLVNVQREIILELDN